MIASLAGMVESSFMMRGPRTNRTDANTLETLFAGHVVPANFKGALISSSRTRRRNPGHSLRAELKTRQIGQSRANWRLTWGLKIERRKEKWTR